MDFEKELRLILDADPLGILNIKNKPQAQSPDDKLIRSFEEINEFISKFGHPPTEGGDIHEMLLSNRLTHIRNDYSKVSILNKIDRFNLLADINDIATIEDVFDRDPLGLLGGNEQDIFSHKFIKNISEKKKADFIAKRIQCKDFEKFEPFFLKAHENLLSGEIKYLDFNESQLNEGGLFIQNGMLLLLSSISPLKRDKFGKLDGRTRVIFENGTESQMKFRTLGKILLQSGKALSISPKEPSSLLHIGDDDSSTGFIYILKSLSTDPEIAQLKDLYKIGFSSDSVASRIKNAPLEPTYLMAEVELVAEFQTFNVNPHKLEQLIHQFFSSSCLNVDVFDSNGRRYTPREWFVAPLQIIRSAVELIISGDIVLYRYDPSKKTVERR